MKRTLILSLTLAFGIGALFAESVGTRHVVDCGTWIELTATPAEDYHFVRWSDDNRDSVRQIQVHEDAHYVAFFAANCGEYANWPMEFLYDCLLVINKRYIETNMGYLVNPAKVRWYRVVGAPDAIDGAEFPQDDYYLGSGTSLNVGRGTSAMYYGVVDVSGQNGLLCSGLMRSELVQVGGGTVTHPVRLSSTLLRAGAPTSVLGLEHAEPVTIRGFDIYGHFIREYRSAYQSSAEIYAPEASGCYFVRVTSPSIDETLRFLVQ